MQRGDASNFIVLLPRLSGSGVMLVFLRDFVEVLSMPTGSGATLEMKLKTLPVILLVHQYTPLPKSKQLNLPGLVCVLTGQENGRDYIFNSS